MVRKGVPISTPQMQNLPQQQRRAENMASFLESRLAELDHSHFLREVAILRAATKLEQLLRGLEENAQVMKWLG